METGVWKGAQQDMDPVQHTNRNGQKTGWGSGIEEGGER